MASGGWWRCLNELNVREAPPLLPLSGLEDSRFGSESPNLSGEASLVFVIVGDTNPATDRDPPSLGRGRFPFLTVESVELGEDLVLLELEFFESLSELLNALVGFLGFAHWL